MTDILHAVDANEVHEIIGRHQLADGMEIVLDLEHSNGIWVRDARTGTDFLDTFTCFASWPIGYNHPGMQDPAFLDTLTRAALIKPSNSDLYTREMASFVDAFATHVTPKEFEHHFWIDGGGLAVENALKAAFDWKARKLGRTKFTDNVNDLVILHFEGAFHGRTGYTMSLTNTLPDKIGLFPKFDWPRVHTPAIEFDHDGKVCNDVEAEERRTCSEIEAVFAKHKGKVAAIVIEPMQGEGGDRHFRSEFLAKLRQYADQEEALLVFDEVQTGFFGSGKPWLWQHHGVKPDIVSFGKKTQVCGVYAGARLDEIPENVFRLPSRINSTWGGNLVDMVRCRRFIEIIRTERLAESIATMGQRTIDGLRSISRETGAFQNVRGVGSLIAFTCADGAARKSLLGRMFAQHLIALPCGPRSVRFRLPLTITAEEVDAVLERTDAAVRSA